MFVRGGVVSARGARDGGEAATRMLTLCFAPRCSSAGDQLAEMTDRDMELILAGWEKGKAPSYVEVKGVTKAYAPTWHSLVKRFFATCPVVGYISPWSAGLLGFAAGAAASLGVVAARGPEALR